MNKQAILLANLGSPNDCSETAVRQYLDQFLMDPSVIQLPWLIRRLLVSLLVLPKRPKASAEAYKLIWTEQGSPLLVFSRQLLETLQQKVKQPIFLAMRYGCPSIESQVLEIAKNSDIEQIYFIPLYPHYAESTVATSILEVERVIKKHQLKLTLKVKPCFYNDSGYINALVKSASPFLFERVESKNNSQPHLLFSYHGLPESHLTKADPTNQHCLKSKDCCQIESIAQQTCYKHQVLETTRLFVEKVGFDASQYSVSFQSRLGRAQWLEPSTENKLVELAQNGIKDLVVICPAFVTDCLETLEEIEIRGRQVFIDAGGRSLRLIPCLNSHPDWVKVVAQWCDDLA